MRLDLVRPPLAITLLLSLLVSCGGAVSPPPPLCGAQGACPQGLVCWPDGRCRLPLPVDLGAASPDGGADLAGGGRVDLAARDLAVAIDLARGPDLARGCGLPCADPTPLCDPDSGQCVPCLPKSDLCPVGSYCEMDGNGYRCARGCKDDADCKQQNPSAVRPACCNRACADLAADRLSCGACGQGCGNRNCCAGACSDPMSDLLHCGACGRPCMGGNATWACVAAACAVVQCGAGFGDCNKSPADGCEADLRSDSAHCGACGQGCSRPNGTGSCMAGKCSFACNPGFADCNQDPGDGCEVNLGNSVQNCGVCGQQCNPPPNGAAACVGGRCAIGICLQGFDDCDKNAANGCETPVGSDIANCGACGSVCKPAPNGMVMCVGGVCLGACGGAFKDCNNNMADGCETNTDSDPSHCKGCGIKCNLPNAVAGCSGGCVVKSCNPGFGDCNNSPADGCEANFATDSGHCGGCGMACPMNQRVCVNGKCSDVPALPFFNSMPVRTGQTVRGAGAACGTVVTVSQSRALVAIAANLTLPAQGNIKFMVWSHPGHQLLLITPPKQFAAGSGWLQSTPFAAITLQQGQSYDFGATVDIGSVTYHYDTAKETQNGISSLSQNPNWTNYAGPVMGGHAGVDCGIQLF